MAKKISILFHMVYTQRFRNIKSYTIVEMLVVLTTVAVLFSLTVVGIQSLQKQARLAAIDNDLKNIQAGLESYHNVVGKYPTHLSNVGIGRASNEIRYKEGKIRIVIVDELEELPQNRIDVTIGTKDTIKLKIGNVYYKDATCKNRNVNIGSPNEWYLNYAVTEPPDPNNNAQKYSLYGCTEDGKTANFGVLN